MSDLERHLASEVEAASPDHTPAYADVLARRDRRRTRRRAVLASAGAAVLVAAVLGGTAALGGDDDPTSLPPADTTTSPPTEPTPTESETIPDVAPEWDGEGAPPVVLQLDGREIRLEPWGYCYGSACVDGMAQPPFEDAGTRDTVPFSFPLKGWSFTAALTLSGGGDCARTFSAPVRQTGDHTFVVRPAGPAGSYDVQVFGEGPEGDVTATFAWTTGKDGQIAESSAMVAFVADHDGELDTYGMELSVGGLAKTPAEASATLVVFSRDGSYQSIGPVQPERPCRQGSLFFREDRNLPEVSGLGDPPFHYRVELVLDGTTYVGTAVWPRDENEEPPYTDLTFSPPLPAYTG